MKSTVFEKIRNLCTAPITVLDIVCSNKSVPLEFVSKAKSNLDDLVFLLRKLKIDPSFHVDDLIAGPVSILNSLLDSKKISAMDLVSAKEDVAALLSILDYVEANSSR